jgi:hypothetical protein
VTVTRDIPWWFRESAVRIGSLWVQGRHTETMLARYAKPIFCLTNFAGCPYSLVGSATAVRFREKCFLLWCRHQTREFGPDEVTIPIDAGKTLISGSRFLFIKVDDSNRDEEFTDLCAMEFIADNYGAANLEFSFFQLKGEECWTGNTDARFFVFGFPTDLRMVDYEKPHIDVRQVVSSGRYLRASHASAVHCLEMTRIHRFSADGLSGGPVFHLGRNKNGFFAGLAGIMMRGGNASEYIHFLDARFVVKLLERLGNGHVAERC